MENVYPLTEREQEIFELIAAGWANTEVAAQLGINIQTVKNQISSIYYKLGADSRSHAVIIGIVSGILNPFVVACYIKPQIPLELRSSQPEPAEPVIDFGKIRAIWE